MPKSMSGFTLSEMIVSLGLSVIVCIAAVTLLNYVRDTMLVELKNPHMRIVTRAAVNHLVRNINNAAWIELVDENNIKLHSHSYPKVRAYKFEKGLLKYIEFTAGDGSSSYSLNNVKDEYEILADNLYSNVFFAGEDVPKQDRRYRAVKVDFVERRNDSLGHTRDVFQIKQKIYAKESWDFIYVDPDTVNANIGSGKVSYEDGTMVFPYSGINTILSAESSYPPYCETVFVLSGEHTIDRNITLLNRTLYFNNKTKVTLQPGITIHLDNNGCVIIEGDSVIQGTPSQKIRITGVYGVNNVYSKKGQIIIYGDKSSVIISYISVSNCAFRVERKPGLQTVISNSSFSNPMYNGLYTKGAGGTTEVKNCYFNCGLRGHGSDTFSIHDNSGLFTAMYFFGDEIYSYPTLVEYYNNNTSGYMGITMRAKAINFHNNTHVSIVSTPWWTFASDDMTFVNNYVKAGLCIGGVGGTVSNNTFEKCYFSDMTGIVTNNIFKTGTLYLGLNNKETILKNNHVDYLTLSYPNSTSFDQRVNNNIIGTLTINVVEKFGSSGSKVRLTNCVFLRPVTIQYINQFGGAPPDPNLVSFNNVVFSNNIFVGSMGTGVTTNFMSKICYSNVVGGTGVYGNGTISQDPLFISTTDYHLQQADLSVNPPKQQSPCIGAGANGVDMGIYGGPDAAGWSNGVGKQ